MSGIWYLLQPRGLTGRACRGWCWGAGATSSRCPCWPPSSLCQDHPTCIKETFLHNTFYVSITVLIIIISIFVHTYIICTVHIMYTNSYTYLEYTFWDAFSPDWGGLRTRSHFFSCLHFAAPESPNIKALLTECPAYLESKPELIPPPTPDTLLL